MESSLFQEILNPDLVTSPAPSTETNHSNTHEEDQDFVNPSLASSNGCHQQYTLPQSLEMIQRASCLPNSRHRWNTNEEIASFLIAFDRHEDWLSHEVSVRSVLCFPC